MIGFDTLKQLEYKPDILPIVDHHPQFVGKTGKLEFIGKNGIKSLQEDIYYKKYLKYKQKYLSLKK